MFLRLSLILIFCFSAMTAAADTADIGFNDQSFQFIYERAISADEYGTSLMNGRFLYNDDKDTRLGSFGLDFIGEPGNVPGLSLGAGAKAYAGSTHSDVDFANLAIGVRADYLLPQLQGLGVAGRFFYAPKVFSFRDSERLLEAEARLTYMVLPKVKVYLGYQNTRFDVEDRSGHTTADDSFRIGFVGSF